MRTADRLWCLLAFVLWAVLGGVVVAWASALLLCFADSMYR